MCDYLIQLEAPRRLRPLFSSTNLRNWSNVGIHKYLWRKQFLGCLLCAKPRSRCGGHSSEHSLSVADGWCRKTSDGWNIGSQSECDGRSAERPTSGLAGPMEPWEGHHIKKSPMTAVLRKASRGQKWKLGVQEGGA